MLQLFREARRVGGQSKRLAHDARLRLVMGAALFAFGPHGHDHVGANRPDHANVIVEDLLLAPLLVGLIDAERIAEVDGAREVLLGAVVAVDGGQFLGPQHAQRLEQLGADLVLPAGAARGGQHRRAVALAVREHGEHGAVLIVRVADGLEEDADIAELSEHEAEADLAGLAGDGSRLGAHRCGERQQRQHDNNGQHAMEFHRQPGISHFTSDPARGP